MPIGENHGRKPPNPQKSPTSHGKRPKAPKSHASSGNSSKPGPAVSIIAILIFGVPFLVALFAVTYVATGGFQ